MSRFVEFRTYQLKPATCETFQELMTSESVPLLHAWGMDVVHHGPCALNPHGYVLIRAYESLEDLGQSQEAFYASRPWREGPREAILACIELTTSLVLELEDRTVQALRSADGSSPLGLRK
jgi:hypothetical protein